MRHSVAKSWLNLLCTVLVTVSLFGAPRFGAVETTSAWSQASILPVTKVSQHVPDATLTDGVSRVVRSDKPVTPGLQPAAIAIVAVRPMGLLPRDRKFQRPRPIGGLSAGASLVGIVELRL